MLLALADGTRRVLAPMWAKEQPLSAAPPAPLAGFGCLSTWRVDTKHVMLLYLPLVLQLPACI